MPRTCFFHAGCPDGFGAAWAVRHTWGGSAAYVARGHNDRIKPGRLIGHEIAFVDIAPSLEELEHLVTESALLHIVDHHITAKTRIESSDFIIQSLQSQNHQITLDLEHSGAVLAWKHFLPDKPVPDLLLYIEDQDLWRFDLDFSREINAALSTYAFDFDLWDKLATKGVFSLISKGQEVVLEQTKKIDESLKNSHKVKLGDELIEAVNSSALRAWIGHKLALRAKYSLPYGLVYELRKGRIEASIYSIGDLDVSEFAVERGGGGHKNASGFSVSLTDWRRLYLDTEN